MWRMNFTEVYSDSVGSISLAARSGSLVQVRSLIRSGLSLDVKDNRGWTCLHEAAARGHKGCVREILTAAASSCLDFRAFVNAQTHEGETAVFLASGTGSVSVVRLLLKAKADLNLQTNELSSPLYSAVDRGQSEMVQLLLKRGAEVNRSHTASCWTCLHQAVYKDHKDLVLQLSEVCDLEAVDDHRITPLFVSAQYGRVQCLRALLRRGARVDAQAADGASPLLLAAQEGHSLCVEELLSHGADPNLSCSKDWRQLPLHAAAQFGHTRILRRLLPITDRSIGHTPGQVSPLYLCVQTDQQEALQMLLRHGYSPDAQDCEDLLGLRCPLSQAVALSPHKGSRLVQILLGSGATVFSEVWDLVLRSPTPHLLQMVLDYRSFPGPPGHTGSRDSPGCGSGGRESPGSGSGSRDSPGPGSRRVLGVQELASLTDQCLNHTGTGLVWMPLLLRVGLDPRTLLQHRMFCEGPAPVLNLLLQVLDWSGLSPDLRRVLDQRRTETGTNWDSFTLFDSAPSLAHLSRVRIGSVLGSSLSKPSVLQQLPVPASLHNFLQFRDVLPSV